MKAMIVPQLGGADVFEPREVEKPSPGPGQLLIRVKATSVNPIDVKVRSIALPMTPDPPSILHGDVAGIVEEVGPRAYGFIRGQEVYGCAGGIKGIDGDLPGALAEFMLVDHRLMARKPRSLDFRAAAALPLVSLTAWLALHEKVRITRGMNVLVQGGTGGVGHIAVQLAHLAGAKVFTTISSDRKAAIATELGADVAINYTTTTADEILDTNTGGRGFDIIFDTVGGEVLDGSFRMIKPQGEIITIVGANQHHLGPLYLKGATLHTVLMLVPMMYGIEPEKHGKILAKIAQLVDNKRLSPLLDEEIFGLDQVARAHQKLEEGRALGKVVITID